MGNCCLERSRRCGGGGGSAGAVHYARTNPVWVEDDEGDDDVGRDRKEEARKGEGAGHAHAPAAATTEVKIRITRKQLEELLRRVEGGKHGGAGGAPVQEVISDLLCAVNSSSSVVFRHREEGQWRPSLQTIPE